MERALRSYVWHALGYALVLEAMLAAAILFWPEFRDNIGAIRSMAKLPVLGDMVRSVEAMGVQGYVILQHFFQGCNTLGVAAAVLFAMGAVAGEAQRGTLELWLARPLARRRVLAERFVAGALAVAVPVFLTSATIPWLLAQVGEELPLAPLLLASAHQSLFLIALYAATFLLSCAGSRPIPIAFGMLLFTTLEFALYLVHRVTHTSVFRLSDAEVYGRIFAERALDPRIALPLVAFTIACAVASDVVFHRRVP